jgi:hypothetical protein
MKVLLVLEEGTAVAILVVAATKVVEEIPVAEILAVAIAAITVVFTALADTVIMAVITEVVEEAAAKTAVKIVTSCEEVGYENGVQARAAISYRNVSLIWLRL